MTIIFKAKSKEGYNIKILAELLANNLKTGCFEIDENGIFLRMMDNHRIKLIDLNLMAENFSVYKLKTNKMYIGLNLNHFHTMLKSIKKKDSIQLFIDSNNPTDLGIKVIPKENNRITTSYIKIQSIQNIVLELPTEYGKPVLVSSSDYQKMCKDMGNIGDKMKICSKNFHINFDCNAGGILKRNVQFGEVEDSDGEDESEDSEYYEQVFDTEQLCRITKISGLNTTMQIFPGTPLLFRSNIGTLGKISIYIKSKEQIDIDSQMTEHVDSDSE